MRFLLLALFPVLAAAAPLPRQLLPQAAVLEAQADEEGRKVWHTRFFRIDSDLEMPRNQLLRLAQVADTTAMAVKSHPLPLFAPPEGRRSRIAIHADPAAYVKAGGAHGSAGFYVARNAMVLVRGDFLTHPRDPARALLPPNYDEDILVHELVHLCMHRRNAGLPQWLLEGLAEYFACAHAGGGRFEFADMDKAVLAHYHLHGGARRLETLEKHLAAAPKERGGGDPGGAGDAAEIQASLVRFWQPKGLTLRFIGVK